METGDNKFEKLKLDGTGVVIGRGPLVETETGGHRSRGWERSTSGNRGQ